MPYTIRLMFAMAVLAAVCGCRSVTPMAGRPGAAARETNAVQWGEETSNPFAGITAEGRQKLEARGVRVARLLKMRAVLLTGNYCGAQGRDFVNSDRDVILVIGRGFITHGNIRSAGPICARGDAHFMGNVTGSGLVWFVEDSFPRGTVVGNPVIVAPTVNCGQMTAGVDEVWRGDYGWRASEGQAAPKP